MSSGLIRFAVLLILLMTNWCAAGDDPDSPGRESATVATSQQAMETNDGSESGGEEESELRRKSALAGMLILALICLVFLVLIAGVVLWAHRLRRIARQPLPEHHPGDALWYLRRPGSPESGPD